MTSRRIRPGLAGVAVFGDLLPAERRAARVAELAARLNWQGPVYGISALTAEGTSRLVQDVMTFLEKQRVEEQRAAEAGGSGHGA